MRSVEFLQELDEKRLLANLAECAIKSGAITVIVNESTGSKDVQLNEAGIKDFFEKGKDMLLAPLQKGAIKADELKDKIVAKLGKEKSGAIMKQAQRFGKPALAFLLIGGAMMGGMGDVQASELMPGDMPDAHGAGMETPPAAGEAGEVAQGIAAMDNKEFIQNMHNFVNTADVEGFKNVNWSSFGKPITADQAMDIAREQITGNQTDQFIEALKQKAQVSLVDAAEEYKKLISAALKKSMG